jgi:hypothetical protein
MALNEEFCVEWANAQLAAGADALAYFDPVASPSMVPRERYLATGFEVDRRTLSRIRGPAAFHFASARGLALVDDVARTSAAIVTVSALEDVAAVKAACRGRLAVLGNLNALEMRRWTTAQADARVSDAIARGGRGGRFILGDNHGEIPWQVPEAVLETVAGAVERHGRYSLDLSPPCPPRSSSRSAGTSSPTRAPRSPGRTRPTSSSHRFRLAAGGPRWRCATWRTRWAPPAAIAPRCSGRRAAVSCGARRTSRRPGGCTRSRAASSWWPRER